MFKKVFIVFIFVCFSYYSFADEDWTLIPAGSGQKGVEEARKQIKDVGTPSKEKSVWDKYNDYAEENSKEDNVGTAFASGIFSWDTIFNYLKYLVKLLSQIGLVIGALMIIYAGYKYATGVFTGDASKGGKDAIKGAIYGLIIVIFSYAFLKILLSMFW